MFVCCSHVHIAVFSVLAQESARNVHKTEVPAVPRVLLGGSSSRLRLEFVCSLFVCRCSSLFSRPSPVIAPTCKITTSASMGRFQVFWCVHGISFGIPGHLIVLCLLHSQVHYWPHCILLVPLPDSLPSHPAQDIYSSRT